jgi:pimeloyl-ACP methyl ester carboxylesterase
MPNRTVNGIDWFYEERGAGRALVLLHAFPMDHRLYAAQLGELSGRFRVICPDLPGFGRTRYDGPFTVKWQAEQVRALLGEIGALPCVIGGCSMGGYVALAFEKEFPRDAEGLVLIDTKAEGDNPEQRKNRDRLIELIDRHGVVAVADGMLPKMMGAGTRAARPGLEGEIRAVAMEQSATTLKHALAALRDREDRTEFLPSIADPVLIVVGEDDQVTPVSCAEALKAGIPNATVRVIPGAGHLTPVESPGAVNEAIREFVEGIGG